MNAKKSKLYNEIKGKLKKQSHTSTVGKSPDPLPPSTPITRLAKAPTLLNSKGPAGSPFLIPQHTRLTSHQKTLQNHPDFFLGAGVAAAADLAPPLATTLPAAGFAAALGLPMLGLAAAALVGTGRPVAAAFFSAPTAPPVECWVVWGWWW